MGNNVIPAKTRRHPADRIETTDDDGRPVAITLYHHPGRATRWIELTRADTATGAIVFRRNWMYSGRRYDTAFADFAEARTVVEETAAARAEQPTAAATAPPDASDTAAG